MIKNNKKNLLFLILLNFILFFESKLFASENVFFLSLKKNEVNLRQGPSFKYTIILTYKKKYLPIKDFESNVGWIHISQLSKKKSAINIENSSILFEKSTIFSKPVAKLEAGRLVLIERCKVKWCKINSDDFTGWTLKKYLWGTVN